MKTAVSPCHSGRFRPALPSLAALLTPLLACLAPTHAADIRSWVPLPTYTLTDLWLGSAEAINDRGDVAGINSTVPIFPIFAGHAVLHEGGHLIYLDALLGLPAGTYSLATSINLAGQAVGYFFDNSTIGSGGGSAVTSFLYANGQIQTFKVPGNLVKMPGSLDTLAFGINNFGQVTGIFYFTVSGVAQSHAFLRQPNGVFMDLDIFGSPSVEANAINDLGQVAGSSQTLTGIPTLS